MLWKNAKRRYFQGDIRTPVESMYQVIPRKYRPKRFKEVVGHEAVVRTLKNALRLERTAQAYLFCGSRGTGKTTLARLFAKALNCHQLDADGEPCNQCPSCLDFLEERSLDILEIDGASNRGIEDIRQLNETVGFAASTGKYKIYIIDEVHMLTKEAFNALLKTLEEPPPFVKFFFATTELHKVLPTIVSRCQRFELSRISLPDLLKKLGHISQDLQLSVEPAALEQIAELADGSLRDAESLLDQLACYGEGPLTLEKVREAFGLLPRAFFESVDNAILAGDVVKARELAETLYSAGKDPHAAIDALQTHYRSHLVSQTSPFSSAQTLQLLDLLLDAEKQLGKSSFKRIHLEMLLISLARSQRHLPLEHLIQRLLSLESRLKAPHEEKTAPAPKPKGPMLPEAAEPPPVIKSKPVAPQQPIITPAARHLPPEVAESSPTAQSKPVAAHPIAEVAKFTPDEKPKPAAAEPSPAPSNPGRYETLLRFAAVELEGTLL